MAETAGGIYYPTKEDGFDLEHDLPDMAKSVEARFTGVKGDATLATNGTLTLAKPAIAGSVSAAGAVSAGSGFTAERTATGVYKITLAVELTTNGIMVGSPLVGAPAESIQTASPGKKTFEVRTLAFDPNVVKVIAINSGFNFSIKPL